MVTIEDNTIERLLNNFIRFIDDLFNCLFNKSPNMNPTRPTQAEREAAMQRFEEHFNPALQNRYLIQRPPPHFNEYLVPHLSTDVREAQDILRVHRWQHEERIIQHYQFNELERELPLTSEKYLPPASVLAIRGVYDHIFRSETFPYTAEITGALIRSASKVFHQHILHSLNYQDPDFYTDYVVCLIVQDYILNRNKTTFNLMSRTAIRNELAVRTSNMTRLRYFQKLEATGICQLFPDTHLYNTEEERPYYDPDDYSEIFDEQPDTEEECRLYEDHPIITNITLQRQLIANEQQPIEKYRYILQFGHKFLTYGTSWQYRMIDFQSWDVWNAIKFPISDVPYVFESNPAAKAMTHRMNHVGRKSAAAKNCDLCQAAWLKHCQHPTSVKKECCAMFEHWEKQDPAYSSMRILKQADILQTPVSQAAQVVENSYADDYVVEAIKSQLKKVKDEVKELSNLVDLLVIPKLESGNGSGATKTATGSSETPSDAPPVAEQVQNVVFAEQQEPMIGVPAKRLTHRSVFAHLTSMPEQLWDVAKILNKPYPIEEFDWPVTSDIGTDLLTIDVFRDFSKATQAQQQIILQMFTFARADVVIKFQLMSTKFHSGLLNAYFLPLNAHAVDKNAIATPDGLHMFNTITLQHVLLDANETTIAELRIPYFHVVNFLHLYTSEEYNVNNVINSNLGSVVVEVIMKLRTSDTASQKLHCKVWMHLEKAELHVPFRLHKVNTPSYLFEAGVGSSMANLLTAGVDAIQKTTQGDVMGLLSDGVSIAKSLATLDNPTDPQGTQKGHPSTISPLTQIVHQDNAERLGALPTVFTAPPKEVVGDTHEMNLFRLAQRESIIFQGSVTTKDTVKTVLINAPLLPFIAMYEKMDANFTLVAPSNMMHCLEMFQYWKGGMELKVRFACTEHHSMQLQLAVFYAPYEEISETSMNLLTDASNQLIFKVGAQKEVVMSVPYISSTPYKVSPPCPVAWWDRNGVQHNGFPAFSVNEMLAQFIMTIQAPLVVNGAVSTTIDYIITARMTEDCYAWGLSKGLLPYTTRLLADYNHQRAVDNDKEENRLPLWDWSENKEAVFQSGNGTAMKAPMTTNMNTLPTKASNAIVPGRHFVIPGQQFNWGESFEDLSSLLNQYQLIDTYWISQATFEVKTTACVRYTINSYPMSSRYISDIKTYGGKNIQPIHQYIDWMSKFGSSFATYWGGMRYKLLFDCDATARLMVSVKFVPLMRTPTLEPVTVNIINDHAYIATETWQCQSFEITAQKPFLEFEIPYSSMLPQLRLHHDHAFSITGNDQEFMTRQMTAGYLQVDVFKPNFAVSNAGGDVKLFIYRAGADNFIMSNYIGPKNQAMFTKNLTYWAHLGNEEPTYLLEMDPEAAAISKRYAKVKKDEATRMPGFLNSARLAIQSADRAATQVYESTVNMEQSVLTTSKDIQETMAPIKEMATTMNNGVQGFTTWLQTLAGRNALCHEVGNQKWSLPMNAAQLSLHILQFVRANNWFDRILCIVNACMTVGIAFGSLMDLGARLMKIFHSETPPQQPPKDDEEPTFVLEAGHENEKPTPVSMILTAITTLGGCAVYGSVPEKSEVGQATKHFANKMSELGKISSGVKGLTWLFNWLLDFVSQSTMWWLGKKEPLIQEAKILEDNAERFLAFISETTKLDKESIRDMAPYDEEIRDKIFKLRDEADELTECLRKLKREDHSALLGAFAAAKREIVKLSDMVAKTVKLAKPRVDPFCFWLGGPPGTGKSFLMQVIANILVSDVGKAKYNSVFSRNPALPYWDGYTGHTAITIDEFMQKSSSDNAGLNEAIEFLIMCSKNPMMLPMAPVEMKGYCFDSWFVGISSNDLYPTPNDIKEHGAIWRRRQVLCRVLSSLKDVKAAPRGDFSHYTFELLDPLQPGSAPIKVMDWEEFLPYIRAQARYHIDHQLDILNYMSGLDVEALSYLPKLNQQRIEEIVGKQYTAPFNEYPEMEHPNLPPNHINTIEKQQTLNFGDIIYADRGMYKHYGIVISPDRVVHAVPTVGGTGKMCVIKETSMREFAYGDEIQVDNQEELNNVIMRGLNWNMPTPEEIRKMIGAYIDQQHPYHLKNANCEHYARMFRNGHFGFCLQSTTAKEVKEVKYWLTPTIKFEGNKDLEGNPVGSYEVYCKIKKDIELPDGVEFEVILPQALEWKQHEYENKTKGIPLPLYLDKNTLGIYNRIVGAVCDAFGLNPETSLLRSLVERHYLSPQQKIRRYAIQNQLEPTAVQKRVMDFIMDHIKSMEHDRYVVGETFDLGQLEFNTIFNIKHQLFMDKIYMKKLHGLCNSTIRQGSGGQALKTMFDAALVKIRAVVKAFLEKHPWIKALIIALGALTSVLAGWKIISSIVSLCSNDKKKMNFEQDADLEAYSYNMKTPAKKNEVYSKIMSRIKVKPEAGYDRGAIKFAARKTRAPLSSAAARYVHQGGDTNSEDVIESVKKNIFKIGIYRPSSEKWVMDQNVTALKGRLFLCNYHVFTACQPGDRISLVDSQNDETIYFMIFDANSWVVCPELDIAIFEAPATVPPRKNIVSHFIKNQDIAYNPVVPGQVVIYNQKFEFEYQETKFHIMQKPLKCTNPETGEDVMIATGWNYPANTKAGYCGSLLVAHQPTLPRKLLGFHAAGYKGSTPLGFGALVTQELLEVLMSKFDEQIDGVGHHMPPDVELVEGPPHFKLEGSFQILGKAKHPLKSPTKTKIRPSPLNGMIFTPTKGPAILSVNDKRNVNRVDILKNSVQKYGDQPNGFDPEDLKVAMEEVADLMIQHMPPLRENPSHVSEDVAINGLPNIPYYDKLDMKTSPGIPFVKTRKANQSGKEFLFTQDPDTGKHYISDPELRKRLDNRLNCFRGMQRVRSTWQICTKDELVKLSKIYERPKTRTFTSPPVDATILGRMAFMDFSAAFYAGKLKTFSAVGMDVFSPEWTELLDNLLAVGRNKNGGDYENYDGTTWADIMKAAGDAMNKWFTHYGYLLNQDEVKEWNNIRTCLIDETIHTECLVDDCLHMKNHGNPSGSWLTVIVNTIVGAIILRYCWRRIMRRERPELMPMSHFRSNVRDSVYGDDNVFMTSDLVKDIYNMLTVGEELARHGLKYTTPSKVAIQKPHLDWKEFTFLKCHFRMHLKYPRIMLAAMDTDTIQELTNWIKSANDPDELLYSNLNDAMRFAYFHGREYFDDLKRKINETLTFLHKDTICNNYDEHEQEFLAKFGMEDRQARPTQFKERIGQILAQLGSVSIL